MKKLYKLILNSLKEMETGSAESYSNSLNELGRWVLTLYKNNKFSFEEGNKISQDHNIEDFTEMILLKKEFSNFTNSSFDNQIIFCLNELSEIYKMHKIGFTPDYMDVNIDNESVGIPVLLANLLIRVFIICNIYKIDIEKLLVHKLKN
ncbi:hypothetical protein Ana3638_04760 [Anaerocolumna sedimenticola]|uniref:Uncharacterized protein n=1 Tax=Anaerocolumna sedimenticola TaxID=2696063 RepID=A0A6P1TJU1_9FIRM|nr:hypothetical protein [Anaerocolumna sedimenticola]QHQ60176.1 hypothetical protein Ana3638_04760 [Anaerocolumna sedimenticola]